MLHFWHDLLLQDTLARCTLVSHHPSGTYWSGLNAGQFAPKGAYVSVASALYWDSRFSKLPLERTVHHIYPVHGNIYKQAGQADWF